MFWPADWQKRDRAGIACKECEPLPPAERAVGQGHLSEKAREAFRQRAEEIKIQSFMCRTCAVEKPRACFWPGDIVNRVQNGGLSCKHCQPTPPNERRSKIAALTCRTCHAEKPRSEFWPGDIGNRHQNGGLSCKACEPTPPFERRKRKAQSAPEAQ